MLTASKVNSTGNQAIGGYCPWITKAFGLTVHTASAWWPFPFLATHPSLQMGWPLYSIKFIIKKNKILQNSCFFKSLNGAFNQLKAIGMKAIV